MKKKKIVLTPNNAYANLEKLFFRLNTLSESASILHWDMSVMMPSGSVNGRSEQLATLAALQHDLLTAPEVDDWLDAAEAGASGLDEWQVSNIKLMRRDHTHAAAVPVDLVSALSKACSQCEMVWRGARMNKDFARVLPYLEQVLGLSVDVGNRKAEALKCSSYDALLKQFDADVTTAEIDSTFSELEAFLPDLLDRVIARQEHSAKPILSGPFPVKAQKNLSRQLMEVFGFDFDHGRLDESAHPFCGGTPDDVRLTTCYVTDDFLKALTGTIHETGHGLYEQGLPGRWRGQPVGMALGMASHESQSLLMEKQVFCSRAFLGFAAPLFRQAFDIVSDEAPWDTESLLRLVTHVERGFIRIEADEVSYPLHVIVRYRLERAMIEGRLALSDLPEAWNEEMRRLLGIVPPDDALGCLQDIHWYDGAWGYFPTYTLGALMAAQLFEAAETQVENLSSSIQKGDFRPLLTWLRENMHSRASRDSMPERLRKITGKPLGTQAYKDHLYRRYLPDTL